MAAEPKVFTRQYKKDNSRGESIEEYEDKLRADGQPLGYPYRCSKSGKFLYFQDIYAATEWLNKQEEPYIHSAVDKKRKVRLNVELDMKMDLLNNYIVSPENIKHAEELKCDINLYKSKECFNKVKRAVLDILNSNYKVDIEDKFKCQMLCATDPRENVKYSYRLYMNFAFKSMHEYNHFITLLLAAVEPTIAPMIDPTKSMLRVPDSWKLEKDGTKHKMMWISRTATLSDSTLTYTDSCETLKEIAPPDKAKVLYNNREEHGPLHWRAVELIEKHALINGIFEYAGHNNGLFKLKRISGQSSNCQICYPNNPEKTHDAIDMYATMYRGAVRLRCFRKDKLSKQSILLGYVGEKVEMDIPVNGLQAMIRDIEKEKEPIYKPFDPRDQFCWLDFDKKYRGRTFASEEDVIEQTRTDLNRVFCKVEHGKGFIVKKDDCNDDLITIIDSKDCFDLYFNYQCGEKIKEMDFKRYIKLFSNSINRYRTINFLPNNTDPNVFNLWTGFKAQDVKTPDFTPIQMILKHILEVYCDNCEMSYNYFLDLIYFILKYPEKPLSVATFIYSKKHGSGKNIILDFLQKHVFGDNITYYTTGLESVLGNHNHLLKNKKVIVVDECASSADKFVGNFDKFKSMMSGLWLTINPKGVNQYNIRNVLSWFLISNHDDSVRLEASDRRYFCLSVNEKYVGNKEYFKELGSKFTQENGDLLYTYIMQWGDGRDANISVPPMNAFKKLVISKGWSSSIRYLVDEKERMYDEETKTYKYDKDENIVKASDLYEKYKNWCNNNHEKLKSNTKFASDIKDNITKKDKSAGAYYDLKSIVV